MDEEVVDNDCVEDRVDADGLEVEDDAVEAEDEEDEDDEVDE